MSWEVIVDDDGEHHVMPVRDRREHYELSYCWCNPTIDDDVWVHHSIDGREYHETN